VLPHHGIDGWSLTSLQQRLVKTGGRSIKHARYYWLLLADSHLTRRLFGSMLGTLWGQLERQSISQNANLIGFEGVPFQFKKKFKYAHLNHLHMQPFTPNEVGRGCFLNVGSNEAPYVITPFFTCESYTGGVIDDKTTPFIDECLRVARGSWKGNWRCIIVNEDNKSFRVIGDN